VQEAVYETKRLDHLGIVAGVCKVAGIAEWLDKQAGEQRRQVSVGTATVAMILNGLGFSNRQLYLVPQFFENKPVEHLLGEGITADMLNDDCLGRTLDWIYEHDPTTLFAGLAYQARQRFGIKAENIHIDTTSLSVSGEYKGPKGEEGQVQEEKTRLPAENSGVDTTSLSVNGEQEGPKGENEHTQEEETPLAIAIRRGYSRDHRADLKQWMMALATTHDGDVPIFLRPLDGNSSDKVDLSAAVREVMAQLREQEPEEQDHRIAVFDGGGYSEANMKSYNEANIRWISRVPETSTEAKAALGQESKEWKDLSDGSGQYLVLMQELPQGKERWVIVRTKARLQSAKISVEKKVDKAFKAWEKRLWHLSRRPFSCEQDAERAWEQALKEKPVWLLASYKLNEQSKYQRQGRPKKEAPADQIVWKLEPTLQVDEPLVAVLVKQEADFIVATNVLEEQDLSAEQVLATYKEQGGVERGFRFLKDPLFLASSVFVKKPERVMALGFIMVLCLLVYRLAEQLLRSQLTATEQTVPNQVNKPTNRPTMRWIFQCFEGIDLLYIRLGSRWHTHILGLQFLHQQVLRLLGPLYCQLYFFSP
jgi:transposase